MFVYYSIEELGEYFLRKSAEIVYKIDDSIDLGLWEDGAIGYLFFYFLTFYAVISLIKLLSIV